MTDPSPTNAYEDAEESREAVKAALFVKVAEAATALTEATAAFEAALKAIRDHERANPGQEK